MGKNGILKLKALSDITSIDITLKFEEVLKNILKITCETVKGCSGTMMLVDEVTGELKMVAAFGLPDDYIKQVYRAAKIAGVPLTYSPSGTVLETGKYYLVPDVFKDIKMEPWWQLAQEAGYASQIFTPMKHGNNIIGLLNVYWEKPKEFTNEEINFITVAASQASSVVQNAKMCERLKGNIHELKEYKEKLEEKLKLKHRELFESENYQRTIINSSLDGILVIDENGRFEFGNESTFKTLEWPKEELIGQFFMKVIPDDMTNFMLERWNEIQNGIEGPYETKIKTKKGDIKNLYVSHARTEINGKRKYSVVVKDITEYKRLEQQIKESEEKYRDLFDNAKDPMYTIDISGYYQSMNDAGLQILGATREEIIGSHMSSLLTPESYSIALEILKKQISCEPYEQPIRLEIICKNGEHRWGDFTTRIMRDGDKIIGIHGIARDVTEKKKLEEQLAESESKYRELFEKATDGIYMHDADGYIQKMNEAGIKIFGCISMDEVIGTHFSKWLTPKSIKTARKAFAEFLSDKPVQPEVIEIIRKNGQPGYIEITAKPFKDGYRTVGFHGIFRDITEKMRLEQTILDYNKKLEKAYGQLKESEEKYRMIFDNANDGIYIHDMKGYLLEANKAGIRMIGAGSKNEVIGTHVSRWLTEESMKRASENFSKYIRGEKNETSVLHELVRKDGSHIWLEFKNSFIKEGNQVIGIHGIARDITEKKKLEDQLKEYHEKLKKSYEELKETEKLKKEFISNITHELLTPLTSIKGYSELLYNDAIDTTSYKQKKSLEVILRNSDRLISRIKDLLDVAALEKDEIHFNPCPVSINEIIFESVQDLKPILNTKEIDVLNDSAISSSIPGDKEKLIQVITNILSNAIKFTPNKGKITITAREDEDEIKISINDTGIGIPHDKLERIFDRFYQVDGSSSRKYGGFGLGLYICKTIIEKHDGLIWAESNGNGSTFNIVLPKITSKPKGWLNVRSRS